MEETTKTPRRVSNQKEQPRQRGQKDKLDYTSRFVRVIPTFRIVTEYYYFFVLCISFLFPCFGKHDGERRLNAYCYSGYS